MRPTADLRVVDSAPLVAPVELKADLPITDAAAELVFSTRQQIASLISGEDRRLLVIVGPCSTHDPLAALDYAARLLPLRRRHEDLLIVMRLYFEKPRTTVGWKGLINDPHLDDSCDIASGLRIARNLMLDLARLGMPVATEMLDPILPQYLADLVSWAAIGARTTESQTHREMASGLSMPVGYKNGTDGSLTAAINAMLAASRRHSFLGIDDAGRVAIVRTAGNPHGHVVLRGGVAGPNYSEEHIAAAAAALTKVGARPCVMVDCNHDNSGKNHVRQLEVVEEVCGQIGTGSRNILGVMIESNIVAGRQDLKPGMSRDQLVYGQSITDPCIDFASTEQVLARLAGATRSGRSPKRAATDSEAPSTARL
jgi:3-deoxy-7-phosphoheptulonate synthase